MLALIIVLCSGIICALIAGSKRRNSFVFFIIGVLLGPIGIVICLVYPKDEYQIEQDKIKFGEFKKCPRCAEVVKHEAFVCRFCGAEFQKPKKSEMIVSVVNPENLKERIGQCSCGKKFSFKRSELGKRASCPSCENSLILR